MSKLNNDTLAGLILLAFSLLLAFYFTPTQVEIHQHIAIVANSPRFFCYLTAGMLGVLSVILIFLGRRKDAQTAEAQPASWKPLWRGLLSTAIACLYVILANFLGFFVSTALAMTFFLVYFGIRKWTGVLLFLVIVLGFIYLLFVQALKVVMPDGLLF